jgi:hypothetical protein
MNPTTYRYKLESSILSCVLLQQSIYVGADILKSTNFKNKSFSAIWDAILKLNTTNTAINYITLHNELNATEECIIALNILTASDNCRTYIGHESYILLELDIREKFLKALIDIITNKNNYELDDARTAMLKDWIFELQTDEKLDIFDSLALIISLFHKYDFNSTCIHIVEEFEQNILTKAKSLRTHNQYHAICTNIDASSIEENTKQEIIQFIKSKI